MNLSHLWGVYFPSLKIMSLSWLMWFDISDRCNYVQERDEHPVQSLLCGSSWHSFQCVLCSQQWQPTVELWGFWNAHKRDRWRRWRVRIRKSTVILDHKWLLTVGSWNQQSWSKRPSVFTSLFTCWINERHNFQPFVIETWSFILRFRLCVPWCHKWMIRKVFIFFL